LVINDILQVENTQVANLNNGSFNIDVELLPVYKKVIAVELQVAFDVEV
jgi:hypothetical protein